MEGEILEDDRSLTLLRRGDQGLRYSMESLANPIRFPPSVPAEKPTPDTSIMRLPPREISPASEVRHLHPPDAREGDRDEACDIARGNCTIEGVLVRVESHNACGFVGSRCFLSHGKEDLPRDDGQGPQLPGRLAEERL